MVINHCKRLPDEGECIQLTYSFMQDPNFEMDLRKFLPNIKAIHFEHDYHGWDYIDVDYIHETGSTKNVHIMEDSYIIKRSDTDWSVYPEQTFKKMYTLDKNSINNVITW